MSNVSKENCSEQGVRAVVVRVTVITPRIAPRGAVSPELENGRLAELVIPEPMVRLVADPIAVPAGFKNETLTAQEAAVPLLDAVATFVRLIRAVSVEPSPTGGKSNVRVTVLLVCAIAETPVTSARRTNSFR